MNFKEALEFWMTQKKLNSVQTANIMFANRGTLMQMITGQTRGYTLLRRLFLLTGNPIFQPTEEEKNQFEGRKTTPEKTEMLLDLTIGEFFIDRYLKTGRMPDDDELIQLSARERRKKSEIAALITKRYQIIKVGAAYRIKNPEGKGAAQTQAAILCAELEHVADLPQNEQRAWVQLNQGSLKKLHGYMGILLKFPGDFTRGFNDLRDAKNSQSF